MEGRCVAALKTELEWVLSIHKSYLSLSVYYVDTRETILLVCISSPIFENQPIEIFRHLS